jgi:hypothetical protein
LIINYYGGTEVKYKVEAIEEVFYQKVVEAESEEEAYQVFARELCDRDIVEGRGFEVTDIMQLKEERDD